MSHNENWPNYYDRWAASMCRWCGVVDCDGRCVEEIRAVVDRYVSDAGLGKAAHPLWWADEALCAGCEHPEQFFPVSKRREPSVYVLRMCVACPVQGECREYGDSRGEDGVWGGLTRSQREASLPVPSAETLLRRLVGPKSSRRERD